MSADGRKLKIQLELLGPGERVWEGREVGVPGEAGQSGGLDRFSSFHQACLSCCSFHLQMFHEGRIPQSCDSLKVKEKAKPTGGHQIFPNQDVGNLVGVARRPLQENSIFNSSHLL